MNLTTKTMPTPQITAGTMFSLLINWFTLFLMNDRNHWQATLSDNNKSTVHRHHASALQRTDRVNAMTFRLLLTVISLHLSLSHLYLPKTTITHSPKKNLNDEENRNSKREEVRSSFPLSKLRRKEAERGKKKTNIISKDGKNWDGKVGEGSRNN